MKALRILRSLSLGKRESIVNLPLEIKSLRSTTLSESATAPSISRR